MQLVPFRTFIVALMLGVSCFTICKAQFAPAIAPPPALQPGLATITPEQAKEFLGVLASPAFEGRGTGQIGYMKAAHWVCLLYTSPSPRD